MKKAILCLIAAVSLLLPVSAVASPAVSYTHLLFQFSELNEKAIFKITTLF